MNQVIMNGGGKLKEVIGDKKVFLVKGKSFELSIIISVLGIEVDTVFSEYSPNPLLEQVFEGVKSFNNSGCEVIVVVGGGSAIDVAKCIKLFCHSQLREGLLLQTVADTGIPIIAVPTTAGSGSEATRYAVVYKEGVKQSITSDFILPNYVVFEPFFLKSLSEYQKKCAMLDALCQAIEAWWSVNSTDESKAMSRQAITIILEYGEEYVSHYSDELGRRLLEASNLSGQAINITATTAPHAMSYKMTSVYQIPHGHAVAICMLEVWKWMLAHTECCVDTRGKKYLLCVLADIEKIININKYSDLLRRLGIEGTKVDCGMREVHLDLLTNSVNVQRLKNHPVSMNAQQLREIYERILI